jgi:hypothetical protein
MPQKRISEILGNLLAGYQQTLLEGSGMCHQAVNRMTEKVL